MTRAARLAFTAGFVALVPSSFGCDEKEDFNCLASCGGDSFQTVVSFDRGVAQHVAIELCRNADCVSAVAPGDSGDQVAVAGAGFSQVGFGVELADGGSSTVSIMARADVGTALVDGDVYTLRIEDADTSAVLFSHSETVTYERRHTCGQTCLAGSFAAFEDAESD